VPARSLAATRRFTRNLPDVLRQPSAGGTDADSRLRLLAVVGTQQFSRR